jgi:hypothetical protein
MLAGSLGATTLPVVLAGPLGSRALPVIFPVRDV